MNPEELARRAHGLLKELLDLDAEEQRRRVDERCAGEPRLRAEVESLLAASESADGFLEAPALDGELGQLGNDGFVGRQVGNYLLEERLGIGGMGTVFRARELDPARQVALKLMNPGTVDQGALRRFQTEIRILAQLDHPGIARLYASGSWDAGFGGVPWYTMEWIQGGCRLTDYAREEDLDLGRRLELFGQVCEAVEHGHRCGVIHRDLKPSNLLVDADGRPRVIDFGVATFLDPEHQTAHRTTFAGIVGTVGYMSPEQLQESGGLADVCSDVYALGVVLHELLTESHPHDLQETSLVQAIRIVREGTPRRPSALRAELRGDLEAIVLKAMDRDRNRRYRTVAELREDIERYRRGEPVKASPPSRLREARYLARRHRTWVVSGLITFFVLLVATVVSSVLALRLSDEVERRKEAQAAVERERDAQARNAYRANVMAAEGFWRAGEMVSMRSRLTQTLPEYRDWEWHFLRRLSRPADWVMVEHAGRVRDVEFSHDGTRVASTDQYGWLVVSVPGTKKARSLRVFEGEAAAVVWSPEDRALAVASGRGELALVDVDGWDVERTLAPHQGHISVLLHLGAGQLVSAAWDGTLRLTDMRSGEVEALADDLGRPRHAALSHDGTLLALADSDEGIVLFDLATRTERARWEHPEPLSVAFARDDATLWIGTVGGTVEHVDLDGTPRRTVPVHRQDVRHLAPHPTAGLLLSTGGDHAAAVLRVPELEVLARYRGHEETIQAADWSPDGETLVTSSWDGTVQSISRARLEDPGSLRGHAGQVHALAFAPDGRHLASGAADGRLVLWDFERRKEVWRTEEHGSSVRAVSFRADGEVLASGGIDGRVRTWRVTTGALLATLQPGVGRIYALDFLADGRLAVAGQSGVVELYDAGLERLVASWPGHEAVIRDLDVDPLRPQLVSASLDGTLRLWSLEDGSSRVLRAHTDGVYRVTFGAAGTLASGGRDQRLCLWDAATGELLHENRTHGQFVTAIAWRPDGSRLATGSWFETLKIWEPDPLQELLTIHDDPTPVRAACFSPNGRWLLSGGGDGRIRLLDGRP